MKGRSDCVLRPSGSVTVSGLPTSQAVAGSPDTDVGGWNRGTRAWPDPRQAAVYAVLVVVVPRVEEVTATAKEATVWMGIHQAVTWGLR